MIRQSYLDIDTMSQRNNIFTRMDSRIKALACVLALFLVIGLPGFRMQAVVLSLALLGLFWIKTPVRLVTARLVPPILLGAIFAGVMVFLGSGLSVSTGSGLAAVQTAVLSGLSLLARIAASVAVLLLLSVTTPLHELGYALMWFKVPRVMVEILLLTYRYVFVLWDEGVRIREAQTLRLGYPAGGGMGGWWRNIKSVSTLMGMVFIRAYDRAESSFSAMQVRAYNGNISGAGYRSWSRVQTQYMISAVVVLLTLLAVTL